MLHTLSGGSKTSDAHSKTLAMESKNLTKEK